MPTNVLQVEATDLPPRLEMPERYDRAFLLVRWRGRPTAMVTLPVRGGVIEGAVLREAVVRHATTAIGTHRLEAELDYDPLAGRGPLPTATVAICTRDRPDDLLRCLTSVDTLDAGGYDVVVVDSCSTRDDTRRIVERFPGVRYVRADRPGLDIARNLALVEARTEIVAFTDDDAAPDREWLRALQRGFTSERTLCVTGLTLPAELDTEAQECFERTNGFGRGFGRRVFDGVVVDPFLVAGLGAGVNMALRRSVLHLVGPFDEALDAGTVTRSGGDHDMFTRILAAGYCIAYEPSALNWHRHRRDWRELRETVRGYGTGVYAYLTRHFLAGEMRAPLVALGWLRWQLTSLLGRRPSGLPAELALAELRGCLAGPRAYLASRRNVR